MNGINDSSIELFVPGRICLFGEHSDWAGANRMFNADIIPGKAIVTGIESRTSSPVRIPRNIDDFQHPVIEGLFPCGEGAGYSGGIVSSAIDKATAGNNVTGSTQPGIQ